MKLRGGYYEIKPDKNKRPIIYSYRKTNRFLQFWKNVFTLLFTIIFWIIKVILIIAVIFLAIKMSKYLQ